MNDISDVTSTPPEVDVTVIFNNPDENGAEGDGVTEGILEESIGDELGTSEETEVITLEEESGSSPDPDPEKSGVGEKLGVGVRTKEVEIVCESPPVTTVGVIDRDGNGVENLETVESTTLCSLTDRLTVTDENSVAVFVISIELVLNTDGD